VKLLYEAGAYVEGTGPRVRIPAALVEAALRTAPGRVVIANRRGERVMPLEGAKSYFGTGSDLKHTIDLETGRVRASVLRDVADAARLCDALPNYDFVMSYGLAADVPAHRQEAAQFAAMLRSTVKPQILTTFTDFQSLEDLWEIAKLVSGGEQAFQENPFFLIYGQFTSPLQHGRDGLQRLLFCAERKIPLIYVPTIMSGMSGPIDMAGSLTLGNAEALAGLTLHQLVRPGAPFIYGGCITSFDMRDMTIAYGAPEWHVAGAMMSQLSRRYGLPIFSTGGCSDAKCVDEQACIEAAMSLLLAALGGGNLIHDVAYLEMGLCGAPDFLVLNDEIIALARQMLGNYTIDARTLAVDVVDRVGPAGSFVGEADTFDRFREATWYPGLLDRTARHTWEARGSKRLGEVARERARELLKSHQPEPLDPALEVLAW
jgi:trimethylamine--corrinoid protein Co-methyltransferase